MGDSVLGPFLSELMYRRKLSNRALATGAGVSEGVIRNLLLHGIDKNAKDPDPKTLRAIGDYLGIDPERMFRMAGYIDSETFLTARGEVVGLLFDRLPMNKQLALLHILDSLLEISDEQELVQYMIKYRDNPLAGTGLIAYTGGFISAKFIANSLLTGERFMDIADMPSIGPDTEVWPKRKLSDLDPDFREMVLDLVKAKLSLDYDIGMKGFDWK